MKSRVLMAALVVTLLMGARIYACDACDPAGCDPCAACGKSCDLFSGLKKLVACNPCSANECGPCDGIVACSPCDSDCGPCDDLGCDDGCGRKFVFGKRLRGFFALKGCNSCDTGCDACGMCDDGCGPCDGCCDTDCGPCDGCNGCGPKFTFKKFFRKFRLDGCCSTDCCDPCGGCDDGCGPCDGCCDTDCGPCDGCCDPCDGCNGCGPKFGRILDRPRRNVKKFFDGFRLGKCNPCDPCGTDCGPCDDVCCN